MKISAELGHPFSVAIFQNSIFWSDWETKNIYEARKNDVTKRRVIV